MEEKRRFPRYEYELEVQYSTQGIASVEGFTTTKNISKGGARITVSKFVKKGDVLKLDINPNTNNRISGYCKVVWTKDLSRPSAFQTDAGVEFTKIDEAEVDRLIASAA